MRGLVCEMEDSYDTFGLYLEEDKTLIPQIGTYKIPVYYCVKMNDEGNYINYKNKVQTDTFPEHRPIFNVFGKPELNDLEKQAFMNGLDSEPNERKQKIIEAMRLVKDAAETMTTLGANPLRL